MTSFNKLMQLKKNLKSPFYPFYNPIKIGRILLKENIHCSFVERSIRNKRINCKGIVKLLVIEESYLL